MLSNVREVLVGCEHRQLVTDAQFGQKGVDRSDLYPDTSAAISKLRSPDVVFTIRSQQRYGGKPIQDLFPGFWT